MITEMQMRNSEASVIITGGAQGLGLAVARRIASEGGRKIALVGRDHEKGARAVAELQQNDVSAIFIKADLMNEADCRRVVPQTVEAFGSVNALVNAAADTGRGTLLETTPELFERQININVRAPLILKQGLITHLLETGQPGSIVNVLSLVALCGQPYMTSYSAAKGALATLTKNVANAYAHQRIRCNGVMIGWMDTPGEDLIQRKFHNAPDDWLAKAEAEQPMGQLIKPEQLAGLIAYMISPDSGVMTGSLVEYDQNVFGAYPE